MGIIDQNSTVLHHEFEWLRECIQKRYEEFSEDLDSSPEIFEPPVVVYPDTPYARFIHDNNLDIPERLTLLLGLAMHLYPHELHGLAPSRGNNFTGVSFSKSNGEIIPTGSTVLFLCAGKNSQQRIECGRMFHADHLFARRKILSLENGSSSEPPYKGCLYVNPDWVDLLTTGTYRKPVFSEDFPAEEVISYMEWDDLVLPSITEERLKYVLNNVKYGSSEDDGLKRLMLFHGPPGTGKTVSAGIIGKMCGKPVFKVKTSQIVSEFVGVTEKNFDRIFDRAQDKGWILFFDEADSLFSKRIEKPGTANDKFLNNQTNTLLDRLSNYKETVILSTNLPDTLDEAMGRRQYLRVPFIYPDQAQKHLLWEMKKPKDMTYHASVDLEVLSASPNISPDNIQNILNFAVVETRSKGENAITMELLVTALMFENEKSQKSLYDPLRLNLKSLLQKNDPESSTTTHYTSLKKVESFPSGNSVASDYKKEVISEKKLSSNAGEVIKTSGLYPKNMPMVEVSENYYRDKEAAYKEHSEKESVIVTMAKERQQKQVEAMKLYQEKLKENK